MRHFSTSDERVWEHERGRGRRVTGEKSTVGYTASDDPARMKFIADLERRRKVAARQPVREIPAEPRATLATELP
jgi:hypothetical protein